MAMHGPSAISIGRLPVTLSLPLHEERGNGPSVTCTYPSIMIDLYIMF